MGKIRSNMMFKVRNLVITIFLPLILGGCAAALVPMMFASYATTGLAIFKTVQTSTGGSVDISIDDTKLTDEQMGQLKNVRSIAVWPDKDGGAVTFAQTLSEGDRFQVISPARVTLALKKLGLSDDLKLMTASEAKNVFLKICNETNADSLIFGKETGGNSNVNFLSLERGNVTVEFLVSIYQRKTDSYIAEIPVQVKVLVGGTRPSPLEISTLAHTEVAKKIIEVSGQPSAQSDDAGKPEVAKKIIEVSGQPLAQSDDAGKPEVPNMTMSEAQSKLNKFGFNVGTPDGIYGSKTRSAFMRFQRSRGIEITGQLDLNTSAELSK
jgi:hypothetical protein